MAATNLIKELEIIKHDNILQIHLPIDPYLKGVLWEPKPIQAKKVRLSADWEHDVEMH